MKAPPPAYSASFVDAGRIIVPRFERFDGITREWAWEGSFGEGVKVAVIDTGIDATHPDVRSVQGYVAIREDVNRKLVYDTEPHGDGFGHGTACAAVIRSFAPACQLYSVKVLDGTRGGTPSGTGRSTLAGLRWAIDNGMRVCNLSAGTTMREFAGAFHDLADEAYFENVVLVTAANNVHRTSFPSLYSSVISVASHAVQNPYTFYYNPKPPVEFGALGIDARIAWLDHGYLRGTGNSYAAPHMAGLVTKVLAKHPNMTVFQLKSVLRELADNVDRNSRKGAGESSGQP